MSRRSRSSVTPGHVELMERIGDQIGHELARSGSRDAIPLGELTAAWPRWSATPWPATRGRCGSRATERSMSPTASATWAHELDLLQDTILEGLESPPWRRRAGTKVRFATGPIPEPPTLREPSGGLPSKPPDVPPEIASGSRRSGRRDRRRGAPRAGRESRSSEPVEGPVRPPFLVDLHRPRNMAICRAFLMAEAAYTAKDITVLEGLDPVRLRPGMYIGSTGSRGLHHLVYEVVDNAVDEALADRNDLVDVTIHPDNSVTVRDAGARHPGRRHRRAGTPCADRRSHEAPCRREVRRGRLQGVRRAARRRRLGRERALRVADRRGATRRQGVPPGVRPGRAHRGHGDDRRLQQGRVRDDDLVPPRPGRLRRDGVLRGDALTASARDGVPHARLADRPPRRARRREDGGVPLRGRHPRLRLARERVEGHGSRARRLLRGRDRRRPGRDRDAVERLVRRVGLLVRRTTSTRRRAARTYPASARRSPGRSTATRGRRGCSRRRRRTSRARTSARVSRRSSP